MEKRAKEEIIIGYPKKPTFIPEYFFQGSLLQVFGNFL